MKTKFKDLLLYSLATIGVVALFISAVQPQQSNFTSISTQPFVGNVGIYILDSETGEVYFAKHHTNEKKRMKGKNNWTKITPAIK